MSLCQKKLFLGFGVRGISDAIFCTELNNLIYVHSTLMILIYEIQIKFGSKIKLSF